jgi:hypothetical protein
MAALRAARSKASDLGVDFGNNITGGLGCAIRAAITLKGSKNAGPTLHKVGHPGPFASQATSSGVSLAQRVRPSAI